MRKINLKIASVVLLLLFVQNMGLELLVHNCLHEGNSANTAAVQFKVHCSCLNDVFTPMSPSTQVEVALPEKHFEPLRDHYTAYFVSAEKHFTCLRGPPQLS